MGHKFEVLACKLLELPDTRKLYYDRDRVGSVFSFPRAERDSKRREALRVLAKGNRWNPITFKIHERLTAPAVCNLHIFLYDHLLVPYNRNKCMTVRRSGRPQTYYIKTRTKGRTVLSFLFLLQAFFSEDSTINFESGLSWLSGLPAFI